MQIKSKSEAQRRADQVDAFRRELAEIEGDHATRLTDNQRAAVDHYHERLLTTLAERFDIDASRRDKQLSWGMKIASFIGAVGLAASVFFLFYQFWGRLGTKFQVAILLVAPVLAMAATLTAASRERTGYFSKLFGLLAVVCFVLNLSMLGQIFNITPSPNAFLVWALFAFLLAYAADARLLLVAGIVSLAAYLSARAATWSGCYWIHFGERPENFFPAALVLFLVSLLPHHRFSGFALIYRVFAQLLFFLPVLILSNWGRISHLPLAADTVEALYQIVGFAVSASAIWLGVRRNWPEVANTGNVFFAIFLYTKFYDWWWDWMPKYLFFLLVGLTAVLLLLIFKRLRTSAVRAPEEVAA
jgi:uncharacterized membrane protein